MGTSASWAGFLTGNELYDACKSSSAICLGYIEGITDAIDVSRVNGAEACIPEHVTVGQVREVVKLYLQQNPQTWHAGASGLVATALSTAFPCKNE